MTFRPGHTFSTHMSSCGPGSQIKLVDLGERGEQLAPPLQLSLATYLEYGSQTRVGTPKIVDDGTRGALVIWPELVDKGTYALKRAPTRSKRCSSIAALRSEAARAHDLRQLASALARDSAFGVNTARALDVGVLTQFTVGPQSDLGRAKTKGGGTKW